MNHFARTLFFLNLLWFSGVAPLGAEKALAVKVRSVEGEVAISMDERRSWRKVRQGAELKAGVRLRTGADGKADVELGRSYALLRLRGNSDLEVREHGMTAGKHETHLILDRGKILGTLRKAVAMGAKFEVQSKEWVCGVRGKDFEIDGAGGGRATEGTTVVFVFTEFPGIFENTFLRGGYAASVERTQKAPLWVERVLDSTEHEALEKEIAELRKKYWGKEKRQEE